jgi:hypothetical protein
MDQESVSKWNYSLEIEIISNTVMFILLINATKNNDENALFILYT